MTINELESQRSARKDPLDLPRTLSQREVNAYVEATNTLDQRLAAVRQAAAVHAEVEPLLAVDTRWLNHLTAWRESMVGELVHIKAPIRDKEVKERADALSWSIRVVDVGLGASTLGPVVALAGPLGDLMHQAGHDTVVPGLHGPNGWRGSVEEVTARISELSRRKAQAQATLDALLRLENEQAAVDAERATLAAALSTMRVINTLNGNGLTALTLAGDPLPESAMSSEQRKAFAWMQQRG